MRSLAAALVCVAISSGISAQGVPKTYWGMLVDNGRTWCGFTENGEFVAEAQMQVPDRSSKVTYSSRGELMEVSYDVQSESRDWIVIDTYTALGEEVHLRRENRLAREGLAVIEETTISGGKAGPFQITRFTTLYGEQVNAKLSDIDFPYVAIRTTSLDRMPFVSVASEMRSKSIDKACKEAE